jgi:membrane protein YfhO
VAVRPQANLHLLALQPNVPMNYGLYDARGYDYPVDRRFDRFWHRNVTGPIGDLPPVIATASPQARRALGLLSVADVLQEPQDPPLRDAQLAYQGPDARVYANQYALPRVFLVSHQRVVKGGDAALALVSSAAFDGRRAAVTERRISQLAEGASQAGGTDGQASLVSYHAERVVARTASPASSMMVLTDAYYPGWQAKVDGRPASIHRVDYLLRGVLVPAGRHRVEFEYKPVSWRVGWIVSAVTLLALLATALLGWRARRKVPGD